MNTFDDSSQRLIAKVVRPHRRAPVTQATTLYHCDEQKEKHPIMQSMSNLEVNRLQSRPTCVSGEQE